MILRWIELAGWRRFVAPTRVGPFSAGLNVVYAPNGSGKSTLFEALLRGLLDGHAVTGREVEALRPWGRALSPTVTIEFAHGGHEYRLAKRFLDHPTSELSRRDGDQFVPLAPGEAADEQARAMLSRNPPGRGLSRLEHWGLAQVLWAPQGGLALGKLSGDLLAGIRQSLGAHVLGPGGSALEQRLEEAYGELYTPGGRLRAGKDAPAVVRTQERAREATARLTEALAQHRAFEDAAARVEALRARRRECLRASERVLAELTDTRARAATYAALVAERRERAERARGAEAQHRLLKQQIAAVRATRRELREVTEARELLRADVPRRAQEVDGQTADHARARAALEDARHALAAADDARQRADDARQLLEATTHVAALARRLAHVAHARAALAARRRERDDVAAPDAAAMRALRRAFRERDDARLRLHAALITLEIVPERGGVAEVVAGEEPGPRVLAAGRPVELTGSPEVVVDVPGVGRLRAWGPSGSVAALRAERDATAQRVAELTRGYSAHEPEALEALHERGTELATRAAEAEAELARGLDGATDEALERDRACAARTVDDVLARHPAWRAAPPDAEALRAESERVRRGCSAAVAHAEAAAETARAALAAASEQRATLAARLEETERLARSLDTRLADLLADGRADDARDAELSRVVLTWDAALARVQDVDAQLEALGDDPRGRVVQLERALTAADDAATRALEDEKTEEGRLSHLAALGTYSAAAAAQEELEKLRAQLTREELQAHAIRLLHDTVAACRNEAVAAIAEPVARAATLTLHRIAGDGLGSVALGASFEPRELRPAGAHGPVALAEASGGEQEQVHLATRLALADVLAREERQLVVLDDALTATDEARLRRALDVLEDAATRLQILVLTCHPERYRALRNATMIDLAAVALAAPTTPQATP